MAVSDIFEGTGVKQYILRRRKNPRDLWAYLPDMQFDTIEEARAALEAVPASGECQIMKCVPFIQYGQLGKFPGSKLRDNVLAAYGRFPYRLEWWNGREWRHSTGLRYRTLEAAQAAAARAAKGKYRVLEAALCMRYKPVEG